MGKRNEMTPEEIERYERETANATQITLFDLPAPAPTVYGYIRVSTSGQAREGYSLESQEDAVRSAGATVIVKDTYTGTTTDRPALKELLDKIQPGDTLVVSKFDRLSRSLNEGNDLIEDLYKRDIKVKILEFGDAAIDNSPTGQLIRNIMLCFAQFERDRIMERTREGKEAAKKKPGYHEGRPRKYSQTRIDYALSLLEDNPYSIVSEKTGIPKRTLIRYKKEAQLKKEG